MNISIYKNSQPKYSYANNEKIIMDKRHQVFLSSTYRDLQDERLEVMRALLELDCIPCGMEYFPAANDDQWTYIKDLIDQCDYYIVVIGGRYGSMDEEGISFTEKEYRYAVEIGLPVIGFIHANPDSIPQGKSDREQTTVDRLNTFRLLVQSRLCKEWSSSAELGAVVSRSLTQLIKRHPRPGWVRANHIASAEASEEIIRLRQQNDQLKAEVDKLSLSKPTGSENLAQGDDEIELGFIMTLAERTNSYSPPNQKYPATEIFTWTDLLRAFGPYFLTESKVSNLKSALNRIIREKVAETVLNRYSELDLTAVIVAESSLQKVIVQFTALGYLQLNMILDEKGKEIRLGILSPLGRQQLMALSAMKSNLV